MAELILLVDDDENFTDLIEGVLTRGGYRVVSTHTADEAVAAVREEPPNLVLLDINMPALDGFDVCEMLQADKVPIVFLSAMPFRGQSERVAYSGASGYLEKPVRPDVLLACVEKMLKEPV